MLTCIIVDCICVNYILCILIYKYIFPKKHHTSYILLQESDEMMFESYARIEHVLSSFWLHALRGRLSLYLADIHITNSLLYLAAIHNIACSLLLMELTTLVN